ncbi:MAG: hypothetical protein WA971_11005, partial [Microbacterium sp.]
MRFTGRTVARVRDLALMTGAVLVVVGCGAAPASDPGGTASAPPSPAPSAAASSAAPSAPTTAEGWDTRPFSYAAGEAMPEGMDTVVVNTLPGHPDFTAKKAETIAETAYEDQTNGCIVTTGVYDQSARTS